MANYTEYIRWNFIKRRQLIRTFALKFCLDKNTQLACKIEALKYTYQSNEVQFDYCKSISK